MKRQQALKREKQPRFLIVENHHILRGSIRDLLTNHFYDALVMEAGSGEDALSMAFSNRPEIILLDIMLPEMNGLEATRKIKTRIPEAKVIILTIYESTKYREDAMASGASAYVLKRRMVEELIPAINSLL